MFAIPAVALIVTSLTPTAGAGIAFRDGGR